jgi:adenylate kinase
MEGLRYSVVYLTGAPAAGKSTLLGALSKVLTALVPFSYSKHLAAHVERRTSSAVSEDGIRTKSSAIVTVEDVRAVDDQLVQLIATRRSDAHIVIDSHAVTKELYGFRVTAFSVEHLRLIRPDIIICLYITPEETIRRIAADSRGRPLPTVREAESHNHLQATVAISYGIALGVPVYFVDSSVSPDTLVAQVASRIERRV